ncbi:hypothetical protein O9X98_10180 [Agrobacterium salinitolerans]|nr:hypothetical protein [Agrobacterium salinitolerans]
MIRRRFSILACLLSIGAVSEAWAQSSESVMFAPTCASNPRNGEILSSRGLVAEGGHVLEIDNGSTGNAIIKVREANTNTLLLSFFVESNQKAQVGGIPDGDYKVQFATGATLGGDCRNFLKLQWAEQFPGVQTFQTQRTATQIITSVLSYTLYEVAGGNVSPQTISAQDFNLP